MIQHRNLPQLQNNEEQLASVLLCDLESEACHWGFFPHFFPKFTYNTVVLNVMTSKFITVFLAQLNIDSRVSSPWTFCIAGLCECAPGSSCVYNGFLFSVFMGFQRVSMSRSHFLWLSSPGFFSFCLSFPIPVFKLCLTLLYCISCHYYTLEVNLDRTGG